MFDFICNLLKVLNSKNIVLKKIFQYGMKSYNQDGLESINQSGSILSDYKHTEKLHNSPS